MASPDVYERAVSFWRERGLPLLPPAPEDVVRRTFADLGRPLSADVLRLYSLVGGFDGTECDRGWFLSLWSLDEICWQNARLRPQDVCFADWLMWSHLYGFRYETPEQSSVFIDHGRVEPYPVAASVAEFLEKLLRDPDEVEAWDLCRDAPDWLG